MKIIIAKRSMGFLMCLLMVLCLCTKVHADIIWGPDDDFYNNHQEDCVRVDKYYTLNGSEGSVVVKESPVSDKTVTTLENGPDYRVIYIYTDKNGEEWGVIEYGSWKEHKAGWVLMKDMVSNSFLLDHMSEYKAYQGEFDDYIYTNKPVVLWRYPGSGDIVGEIKEKAGKKHIRNFDPIYIDSEGKQWGYIGNYFWVQGWICFDEPTKRKLSVVETGEQVKIIPPKGLEDRANAQVLLLIGLIAALVTVTAVLIRKFWREK